MTKNRIGKETLVFRDPPSIIGFSAVGGKKEGAGPLGSLFDMISEDNTFGEKTWEKSESRMQRESSVRALNRAGLPENGVDITIAGDLLNQCIGSSFASRDTMVPLLGVYGACSTMAQSLGLGAVILGGGFASKLLCMTSSHFCSAERQYRFPLEYGSQRPSSAQWTATASGSVVLADTGVGPFIRACIFGHIEDLGIKDVNNMGAAMAPAAAATLAQFFNDTGSKPDDYDLIATGDLSRVGTDVLYELMDNEGFDIRAKHNDCGLILYDDTQEVDSGGSGCGCSASVLCAKLIPDMIAGKLKKLLFAGTGALLSPTSAMQGESIPGICHLVYIDTERG